MSVMFYITLAVVLVGGIISFGVMDALVVQTLETSGVTLESHTVTVGTPFTLNNVPIVSVTNVTNDGYNSSLTVNNNYTIDDLVTGTINLTNYDTTQGACCQVSYTYDDGTYLSGGLSRTIVQYIVPIGLLGLLGMAILFRKD